MTSALGNTNGGDREGFIDSFSSFADTPTDRTDLGTEVEASEHIKRVAKLFGADLVGVTKYDHRWTYTNKYSIDKVIPL